MRERTGGVSSINSTRSIYYMVKVLLAVFVGLFRARPAVEPGEPRAGRRRSAGSDGRLAPPDPRDHRHRRAVRARVRARAPAAAARALRAAVAVLLRRAARPLDLARGAGGARVGGRHLLRAVGAVRGRLRLRARAAAALLARHLAPGRADQGARPARRPAPARGRRAARPRSASARAGRGRGAGRAHALRVDGARRRHRRLRVGCATCRRRSRRCGRSCATATSC